MTSAISNSDITLKCGDQSFLVNKKLLSDTSNYFFTMFKEPWQKGDTSEASLDTLSTTGLAKLLDILSHRPAHLSLDSVTDVLEAADFLQVAEVTRTCEVFLSGSLEPATVGRISGLAGDYWLGGLEANHRRCIDGDVSLGDK